MSENQLIELWWFCDCETHFVHPTSQKQCDKCKETSSDYKKNHEPGFSLKYW